ncbi:cache domain-containing sensor histidine kinase [Cohnella cellulosilytica]|uniref:Sensor histidine kinase n=1 Tax=Cohnella cellulosilytica TaxID=986710 RepID=A0ABW2FNA7_9BACL
MLRPLGFNNKITITFLLVILLLITSTSTIIYWRFHEHMEQQVTRDLNQIMVQNKINLEKFIDSIDNATLLLYSDTTIMEILNEAPSDFLTTYKDRITLNNALLKYLFVPLSSTLTSYTVTFFAMNDIPFAEALSPGHNFFHGFFRNDEVQDEAWYQQTVAGDGILQWFHYPEQEYRLYAARLIKNPKVLATENIGMNDIKQNIGVVVIGFDLSQISKQLEATMLTPSTRLLLKDANGDLLYDSTRPKSLQARPEDPLPAAETVVDDNDSRYLINDYHLSSGWNLIARIPLKDISQSTSFVRNVVLLSALISAIAGLFLSIFLSKQISRPIRKLAKTMRSIHNTNEVDVFIQPPPTNDEVGILYQSFNTMMNRINQLLDENYQTGKREQEAELRALQAQINPHFMYNTLDSVNWLALEAEAYPIVTIISTLSDLLRYITGNSNELVKISEEVEQIRRYIQIQSLCYDNSFDVVYEIDPLIAEAACPKLILQPLVENAIFHGFEKMERRGRIVVSGFAKDGMAVISIHDNGPGTDIERLNSHLQGKNASVPESRGYGIRNVNQRIKLRFGEPYGLRYEMNEVGGVTAVICLPL